MKNKSVLIKDKDVFVSRPTFLRRAFNFRIFLIIAILGFSVLAFFSKQYKYFQFDLEATLFIQRYNTEWFDLIMKFVSILGNGTSVVILVIFLVIFGYVIGKRHASLVLIGSTMGGLILSFVLKVIVSRPRPDPSLISQIGNFYWLDSFPSGHVLGAVSLYGFLFYIAYTQLKRNIIKKVIMGFCILVIILMGLSRIYVGAHWLSDVLGAYLIGFVWLSFNVFIYQKLNSRIKPE